MLKFQPPMLNDEVCRVATDKQTHKYTIKNAYRVKTEVTFFYLQIFIFYFHFSDTFESKKKLFSNNNNAQYILKHTHVQLHAIHSYIYTHQEDHTLFTDSFYAQIELFYTTAMAFSSHSHLPFSGNKQNLHM